MANPRLDFLLDLFAKIIAIIVLFSSQNVFADFGQQCPSVIFAVDSEFIQNTAYGHVLSNIDITTYINGGCDPDDPQLKFCIKNKAGSQKICKEITMNVGEQWTLSQLNDNPSLGMNEVLKDLLLTATVINNKLCLMMPTSRGPMALVCKDTTLPTQKKLDDSLTCRNIGKICYMGASRSQSLFNFSGLAIDCLKESLDKIFYQITTCGAVGDTNLQLLNPFASFQKRLKQGIIGLISLYIVIYGINLALSPSEYGAQDQIAIAIIKIIFVIYFAIGIGDFFQQGKETSRNGMTEYALPILTSMGPAFAQMVFNAGGSKGLCEFSSDRYPPGYQFYGIWDAIDCRIAYYLGMGLVYNTESTLKNIPSTTNNITGNPININDTGNKAAPDSLHKVGAMRFFTVMFGFLMSGNIIIVASGLIFSVIFISICMYFISHYLVCCITIYVMAYISPIFIPMILFKRTKGYFDAWLKVCLSCSLQPVVIAGFIALLLSMYDGAIYKNCEFMRHDYVYSDNSKFSTFELLLPDNNPEECKSSVGYKLLNYYSGIGWSETSLILISIKSINLDTLGILIELLYVLVFSIIFYHFSKSIGQFASELTGGPAMDGVTITPMKVAELIKQAAEFAKNASQGSKGIQKMGKEQAEKESGNAEGKDSAGGAEDKISDGGGSGGSPEGSTDKIGS